MNVDNIKVCKVKMSDFSLTFDISIFVSGLLIHVYIETKRYAFSWNSLSNYELY